MQDKLKAFRMYRDLTQEDMAKLIGVEPRTYVNKEHGVTQFKANEMFTIARKLEKKIDEIFLPTDFTFHEVLRQTSN